METAYKKINTENLTKRWISESFNQCGLNPWNTDRQFQEYLGKLSESGIYAALSAAHNTEVLNERVRKSTKEDVKQGKH